VSNNENKTEIFDQIKNNEQIDINEKNKIESEESLSINSLLDSTNVFRGNSTFEYPVSDIFRAGYVGVVGKPNVGKSTLLNALLGQKLSIVTPKAQTTRHRIVGIINGERFQMVMFDTPGIIQPKYALHRAMMKSVRNSLYDADVILLLASIDEQFSEAEVVKLLQSHRKNKKNKSEKNLEETPVILAVNKCDLASPEQYEEKVKSIISEVAVKEAIAISALKNFNLDLLTNILLQYLPDNPPFFDTEQLSDRPERFFVSEIVREKIFLHLSQEIPYSCDVQVLKYEEREKLIYIDAEIHAERKSQKGILIGKNGDMLKKIGTEARVDIEELLQMKVFLNLYVRITENWKEKDFHIRNFGYDSGD